jgi:hypothetical protein
MFKVTSIGQIVPEFDHPHYATRRQAYLNDVIAVGLLSQRADGVPPDNKTFMTKVKSTDREDQLLLFTECVCCSLARTKSYIRLTAESLLATEMAKVSRGSYLSYYPGYLLFDVLLLDQVIELAGDNPPELDIYLYGYADEYKDLVFRVRDAGVDVTSFRNDEDASRRDWCVAHTLRIAQLLHRYRNYPFKFYFKTAESPKVYDFISAIDHFDDYSPPPNYVSKFIELASHNETVSCNLWNHPGQRWLLVVKRGFDTIYVDDSNETSTLYQWGAFSWFMVRDLRRILFKVIFNW